MVPALREIDRLKDDLDAVVTAAYEQKKEGEIMIQLTVDTNLYLFENDQMEKVMEISRQVLRHGIPVQIVPDEKMISKGEDFNGEKLSELLGCFARRSRS